MRLNLCRKVETAIDRCSINGKLGIVSRFNIACGLNSAFVITGSWEGIFGMALYLTCVCVPAVLVLCHSHWVIVSIIDSRSIQKARYRWLAVNFVRRLVIIIHGHCCSRPFSKSRMVEVFS